MVTVDFIRCFSCFSWFSYCRGNCICAGQGNTIVSHFVVQRGDFTVAIACVPCGPRRYLCVSVRILCVLKIVCGWESKTWLLPYACCGLHFIASAACVLSFDHSAPLEVNPQLTASPGKQQDVNQVKQSHQLTSWNPPEQTAYCVALIGLSRPNVVT